MSASRPRAHIGLRQTICFCKVTDFSHTIIINSKLFNMLYNIFWRIVEQKFLIIAAKIVCQISNSSLKKNKCSGTADERAIIFPCLQRAKSSAVADVR